MDIRSSCERIARYSDESLGDYGVCARDCLEDVWDITFTMIQIEILNEFYTAPSNIVPVYVYCLY